MFKRIRRLFGHRGDRTRIGENDRITPENTRRTAPIRLADFQRDESLVLQAREFQASFLFNVMMDVMRNESPDNFVTGSVQPHDLIKQLGRIEGFRMAITTLRAMTVPATPQHEMVETYGTVKEE